MRALGLEGARRRKKVRTTIRNDGHERACDLLKRDFTASRPHERWVADFTYVTTWSGIVYAAFGVDEFSRATIGWLAATSKRAKLVPDALDTALWRRDRAGTPAGPGLVHNSDAGSKYTSFAFTAHLLEVGIEEKQRRHSFAAGSLGGHSLCDLEGGGVRCGAAHLEGQMCGAGCGGGGSRHGDPHGGERMLLREAEVHVPAGQGSSVVGQSASYLFSCAPACESTVI